MIPIYEMAKTTYYHYDNADYNVGDLIHKHINMLPYVKTIYEEYIQMNPEDLVYCIDHIDSGFCDKAYRYQVELGDFRIGYMEYSPMLCNYELTKGKHFKDYSAFLKIYVAKLFARAYMGDIEAQKELRDCHNYEISAETEIISTNVRVMQKDVNKGDN